MQGVSKNQFQEQEWVKDNREYAAEFPTLGGKKYKAGE